MNTSEVVDQIRSQSLQAVSHTSPERMATPNLLSPSLPQKAVINSVPQGQVSDNFLPELRRHYSIRDEFSLLAGLDWQFCSFTVLQFCSFTVFLDGKNSDSIFKKNTFR